MREHGALIVALLAALVVQSLTSAAVYTPAVLAPGAHRDIGVDASAIGLFTSLVYGCAALSAPLGGTIVGRTGAVRVSQGCLVLAGIGLAMFALGHPLAIVAAALVIGMGYGPVTPASSVLLIERTPDRLRNLIMSIRQTGVPVGGALSGALVPWLVLAVGWRWTAVVTGLLCLAFALALEKIRSRYDAPVAHGTAHPPSLPTLLRMVFAHAELRRVSITSFAYAGMQVCFSTYLIVFLTTGAGFSVVTAGIVLSAAMIAGIVGRIAWGVVADYWGNARAILALLGGVMAVCALAMAFVTPEWPPAAVLLLSVIYGTTALGWNGVYVGEVARVAPEGKVALATGASLALTYLGVVVGPFCFWLIVTVTGRYSVAFGSAAAVTLAAATVMFRGTPAPGARPRKTADGR